MKAQTELTQDRGRPLLSLLGLFPGLAQHDEVVRVADDFPDATLNPGPVEGVQVDVGQQRGDDPALRCARDRLGAHPSLQHPCTQPLSEQFEHPPVRHPLADQSQQPLMVDRTKSRMSASNTNWLPSMKPTRSRSKASVADRFGRNPKEQARR